MKYAAKTFAAVYGLRWSDSAPRARLCYGVDPSRPGDVRLDVGYQVRRNGGRNVEPLRRANLFLDDEADAFPRIHHPPSGVDWLGEIFEWIGGELEFRSTAEDPIGAVPFGDTTPGRYELDPEVPWAAIAMRGLDQDIRVSIPDWPAHPFGEAARIAATHDLDFLPLSFGHTMRRGLKNALIGLLDQRSPRLAASIVASLGRLPSLTDLVDREQAEGIQSSAYVLATHSHRRDANYVVSDRRVGDLLRDIEARGLEVGVHGSYLSVIGGGSLASEYQLVRAAGFAPTGGRQHWLRYRVPELFDHLTAAGAAYDCSVGFNDRPGFRSGASFGYAPYDFRAEAAFPIVELPMVLMDATLFEVDRFDRDSARRRAERVMRRAILYSDGGVSIVWHNTAFGGFQLPSWVGDLYWDLHQETTQWVSGNAAAAAVRTRCVAAGLLD